MKQPVGRPPLLKGALASAATVLALLYLVDRLRATFPRPVEVPAPAAKQAPRVPQGPPVCINPDDLSRVGRERDDNELGMKFCWCPSGSFQMGRLPEPLGRFRDVAVPVEATLRHGFWMGKFEVTQAQWRSVMGVTLPEQRAKDPTQPRPVGDGSTRDHVGEGPDHPIYFVSHAEAQEFCRRLTETERGAGRLEPGWGYRLPTEAEWEFACRAGTATATAFGDQPSSTQANFDGSRPVNGAPVGPYLHETTPVGRYPANAWGLHDMHGNVWEWCLDGFSPQPSGGVDPLQASDSPDRVMRGGCWHNWGSMCLSTSRSSGRADQRGSGLGFRVILGPVGP